MKTKKFTKEERAALERELWHLKVRLMSARDFAPHKVDYYQARVRDTESQLKNETRIV